MMKKNFKNGVALISVLALTTIALIAISAVSVISVSSVRTTFLIREKQQAEMAGESLVAEQILRFLRFRDCFSGYQNWVSPCLQISNTECKMNCSLNQEGATIDVWGKSGSVVKHFRVILKVDEEEKVIVSKWEVF